MASRLNPNSYIPVERLTGRVNYHSWSIAMQAYLQLENLWDTIEAPPRGELTTDAKKVAKARAKLILAVDPIVYVHVTEATTAQQAWKNLQSAFDDNGLERKVGLLRDVVTMQLENCSSMEDYVNKIITAAQQLNGIGIKLPDEWIAILLLAGLPTSFQPMIMALGSSGKTLSSDFAKIKLIQEYQGSDVAGGTEAPGFLTYHNSLNRRKHNQNQSHNDTRRKPRCYNFNKLGHFSRK